LNGIKYHDTIFKSRRSANSLGQGKNIFHPAEGGLYTLDF
jgi:hypothetical protein